MIDLRFVPLEKWPGNETPEHKQREGSFRATYAKTLDLLEYELDKLGAKHIAVEYARGAASTNSIESVWAVLKRGVHGVYHHVSPKHLARYVDEFAFRLNEGNVKRHTFERLDSFVDAIVGKRLTYKQLIAAVPA